MKKVLDSDVTSPDILYMKEMESWIKRNVTFFDMLMVDGYGF